MTRPNFNDIQSFDEFKQYYWYRDELKQICKEHGITHTGTKTELNDNIKEARCAFNLRNKIIRMWLCS